MRKGKVYYKDIFAGIISESSQGEFVFQYDENYILLHSTAFLTFTMPVIHKPFMDNRLFPVFDGLIPEGWLLEIASNNWKLDKNDRMGLLLSCCQNCIGAISILPIKQNEDDE
jgi:serine/threonine-protein kinase HipA